MNSVISSHTLFAPHLLENPRQSPPRTELYSTPSMAGRKRKADSAEPEDRMSTSPSASPSTSSRALPQPIQPRPKRHRNLSSTGRPLDIPRLLETLSATDLRSILTQICVAHPPIAQELVSIVPRPTLESTLSVLSKYETTFKESLPFGTRTGSDYAYNRVKSALNALLDALKDFTPHFLPPHEQQVSVSLSYLDAVTGIVHRLPDWDDPANNRSKDEAYEELNGAWITVLKEAEKRGGGFQLQFGGWDNKVVRHDELSGHRLQGAVEELKRGLGWVGTRRGGHGFGPTSPPAGMDERLSVRNQLLSGTYGTEVGVGSGGRGGPW